MTLAELEAEVDGVALTGSLRVPAGAPRAAVVMQPGSGPSDRDNDDLFPEVRPVFLDAGIAVASFDKRGVGGSGGDWRDAGIEQQAADLLAQVDAVRDAAPGIPVGVYGHSQGGWVAVEAGARAGDRLAFVISSSGPAVPPVEQERYALGRALERVAPDDVATADGVRAAFEAVVAGLADPTWAAAEARTRAQDPASLAWLGEHAWFVGDEREWELSRRLAVYDPAPALAALAAPLLVLYGGAERIVPVDDCVAVLRRTVRPDLLRVAVVPGGDHRLRAGEPTALVPEVAPAIHGFLDEVLAR